MHTVKASSVDNRDLLDIRFQFRIQPKYWTAPNITTKYFTYLRITSASFYIHIGWLDDDCASLHTLLYYGDCYNIYDYETECSFAYL